MSLQKTTLAEIIGEEYRFNGHSVSKGNVVEIVNRIVTIAERKNIRDRLVNDFFEKIKLGELGSLSKNPMDLVVKFNDFVEKKRTKLQS